MNSDRYGDFEDQYPPKAVENVEAFFANYAEQREFAQIVLGAWDQNDFCHSVEITYDEYVGYAKRFLDWWNSAAISANELSDRLVRECVRRSFYATTLAEGFATDDDVAQISEYIIEGMRSLGMEVVDRPIPRVRCARV